MTRTFSVSIRWALSVTFAATVAAAQGAPAATSPAPAATTAAPAATAPPAAPPAPAPPAYAPPPYAPPAEGAPAWNPQTGYPPGYRPPPPMEMKYIEGRPIPAGYHLETRARRGLVVSGPIIFGVPYLLSMSVAASSRHEPDRWLYAPVFGPFVNLATRGDDCDPNRTSTGVSSTVTCTGESGVRFFLMLDGLMQTAGATMLILGLALPQHILVRDDAPYTGKNGSHFAWAVGPQAMGRSGYGLSFHGIF